MKPYPCNRTLSSTDKKIRSSKRLGLCIFQTKGPAFVARRFSRRLIRRVQSQNFMFSLCGSSSPNQESPGKPNQRKGQNEKFMNFAHFCEFWCFSLGKQARFTLNFCSGMPLRKVHEPTFLWFGLPGPLLTEEKGAD